MSTAYSASDLTIADIFGQGIPFEGPIDVRYFSDLPNASCARAALAFLSNHPNELELLKRHTLEDVAGLWRATFRACVAHGVGIPNGLLGYAKRLGVVVP